MPHDELSQRDKIDILKFIHQDQRGEMQHRREREHRIFTWSAGILSTLIGALLIARQADLIWRPYGAWGNLVASAAVLVIVGFSTSWLRRNLRFRGQNAQVIARIDRILHCFDKGYFTSEDTALFPAEWGEYGRSRPVSAWRRALRRVFAANYTSATILLGILALLMIWLPR